MNRGISLVQEADEPWKMSNDEPPPCGDEFELFVESLDAFLDGYFYSKSVHDIPLYTRGDFFGERTEGIYFTDSSELTDHLLHSLQKWLGVPRRQNWRIVIPGEGANGNPIVIYACTILNR